MIPGSRTWVSVREAKETGREGGRKRRGPNLLFLFSSEHTCTHTHQQIYFTPIIADRHPLYCVHMDNQRTARLALNEPKKKRLLGKQRGESASSIALLA